MTGLWIKLVSCTAFVFLTDAITDHVDFTGWFQAVVMGVILAIIGHLMEVLLLRPGRLWTMTILDFFATAALAYIGQWFLPGTFITVIGALLLSSFLTIVEYYLHRWLIYHGKTEKAG